MRKVVALRYNQQKNKAPEIIASGQGLLAARILEAAEKNNIPLYQQQELADALVKLPIGSEIPPELYDLVAKVFTFVLFLDEKESRNKSCDGNSQG